MSVSAFLNTIEPSTAIIAGSAILIIVVTLILGFYVSKKARIGVVIALIIIFLGINIFESWHDLNSRHNQQNTYVRATSGNQLLYDPLKEYDDNTKLDKSSHCKFIGGAFHVISTRQPYLYACIASGTSFKNFAYQVRIIIIHGDEGCIVFRFHMTGKEKAYNFCIGSNGSYEFSVKKPNDNNIIGLQEGFSSAINTGLNQINSIAVVAQGTELDMYVNTLFVLTVNDSTSAEGSIGFGAIDNTSSTEVAFSNAQVWAL